MIEAKAAILSETNQKDQFSLWIFIDGREYRKFFEYDINSKILYVEFEIPQDLGESTSIFISVKDAQYNEVYTTIPENYNLNNIRRNENNSVRSSFGPTYSRKDYGIFSMNVSTTPLPTTLKYVPVNEENKRKNISDLTRSELINVIDGGDYTEQEVPEIIESLEKYEIIPKQIKETVEISLPVKEKYIPKYDFRSEEPKTINGIWNSRTYNSWRAIK
jgi:hypothetical protein